MAVRFRINGLGDVGPEVHYPTTKLKTVAQGASSVGLIVLRDFGQDPREFITGKRIEVDLGPGSQNIWGGYLMRANRRMWFPVDNPDKLHRQWVLTVVDNNILFKKRIVFNKDSPADIQGPIYKTDVYDDDVINDLVTDWLDLSFDGIDVTTKVERVAHSNAGQPFYPINGGMTWGQSMEIIAWLPAAVWYLDPDWKLNYSDVDVESATLDLSDEPGPGQAGYRECVILRDGAQLANDIAGWGFGKGVNHGVFERVVDASSVEAHGLWQDAFVDYGVWKQSTIDRIVDSAINGSPSSKRGRKNDRYEVNLVTYEPGFRVGQKVHFINNQWGEDDVVPVREMELSFESPTAVRYQMKLTHEIDPRWTMFDPLPRINVGTIPIRIPKILIPEIRDIDEEQCSEGVCGITDTLARVESAGWGNSDWGPAWATTGTTWSADGAYGVLAWASGSPTATLPLNQATTLVVRRLLFTTPNWTHGGSSGYADYEIEITGSGRTLDLGVGSNFGFPNPDGYVDIDGTGNVDFDWLPNTEYAIHLEYNNATGDFSANVWEASDPEPSGWMFTNSLGPGDDPISGIHIEGLTKSISGTITAKFRNLDIVDVNRCTASQFEDWNRTISPGSSWGTATPGGQAWVVSNLSSTTISVTPGYGKVDIAPTSSINHGAAMEIFGPGPWTTPSGFIMKGWFRFENSSVAHPEMRWPGIENSGGVGSFDQWVFDGTDVFDYQSSGIVTTPQPFQINPDVTYHYEWEYRCDLSGLWDGVTWSGINILRLTDGVTSWEFTGRATVFPVPSNFLLLVTRVPSAGVNWDMKLGPIDFEYLGRPCIVGGDSTTFLEAQDYDNRNSAETWWATHSSLTGDATFSSDAALIAAYVGDGNGTGGVISTLQTQRTEIFMSHDAPDGATYAILRSSVRASSGSAGAPGTTDVLQAWQIDQGNWGSGTPAYGHTAGYLADGSLLPGSGGGVGPTDALEVIIPVVNGRIQWVWKTKASQVDPTNGWIQNFGGSPTPTHVSVTSPANNSHYNNKLYMYDFVEDGITYNQYKLDFYGYGPDSPETEESVGGLVTESFIVSHPWVVVGPVVHGSVEVWVNGIYQTDFAIDDATGRIDFGFDFEGPTRVIVRYIVP